MAYDVAGNQILAQPVSAFLQGRAIRQAEEQNERKTRALVAAEAREDEAFEMQKQDRQAKYDQINGQKALAGAEQVLAVPKGQRKAFVEKNFAEVISGLEKQGYGTWDEIDEDELEELATGIRARAMRDLGMSPARPEEYTLGKGEKRLRGDKVIAENITPEDDEWTKPEPAMIGGKQVMAQYNNAKGTFRVVEGVSPISGKDGDGDKSFNRANILRDEYNAQAKDFVSVEASYSTIKALGEKPSAAGDIGLLTSYMRMVDPGSTVREGEFATAENAGGVPDRVRSRYNNLLRGERLSDDQRKDFISQAENMYQARRNEHAKLRTRYKDLATRSNVDPLDVIGGEEEPEAQLKPVEPARPATPEEAMKLPPGTLFFTPDGRLKVR